MSLMDRIKADVKRITSNSAEFGVTLVFTSPDSPPVTATVKGLNTQHHLKINNEGAAVNSLTASCSVAEEILTDAGYPVRNEHDKVDLKGHKVTMTDSAGISRQYRVDQWFPDEKLGLIVCILGT